MATALQSQLNLMTGAYKWADFEDPRSEYRDRLAEGVELELSLPEVLTGVQGRRQATVQVKNVAQAGTTVDFTLADVQIATPDGIHGQRANIKLYDLDTDASYLQLNGTVSDVDDARGELTIDELEIGVLQTQIPKRRILDIFPNADITRAPGNDPRLIKPFGEMRQVQLTCLTTDRKDWGAVIPPSSGTIIWNTVYRNKAVAAPIDYAVVMSSGMQIVRFARAQPEDVEIRVDITSTEFANQAAAGQWILSDATDGLGLSVDAASFTAAIAELNTYTYLVHHGLGPEPERAEDVLNELAVRGSVISRNSGGQYTWTVDAASLHTQATYNGRNYELQRMEDGRDNNIIRVVSSRQKRIEERINDYTLLGKYTAGFGNEAYLLRAQSTRTTKGSAVTATNRFLGSQNALRRECGYRIMRMQAERYGIEVEVSPEARIVQLNQRITVRVPHLRYDETYPPFPLVVKKIRGSRRSWVFSLVGYDSAQYTTFADSIWAAAAASQLTDYSYTYPATPTSFVLVGAATVLLGDQNKSVTYQKVQAVAPAANVSHLVFRLVRNGETLPGPEFERPATPGATVQAELSMESGLTYTIEYFARNKANDPAFQDGTIGQYAGYVAAGDGTTPGVVTGISATVGTGKSVVISWSESATSGVVYRVFRNTINDFASSTRIDQVDGLITSDPNVTYGGSYYYWVRARTRSGVNGAPGGPAFVNVQQVINGDLGDLSVSTGKIQNFAVDASKRTPMASLSTSVTISPATHTHTGGGSGGVTAGTGVLTVAHAVFSHGLGQIPSSAAIGGGKIVSLVSLSSTSATVAVFQEYNPISGPASYPVVFYYR